MASRSRREMGAMSLRSAERKFLALLTSVSYPRHCGKHMFVASFSQAGAKQKFNLRHCASAWSFPPSTAPLPAGRSGGQV